MDQCLNSRPQRQTSNMSTLDLFSGGPLPQMTSFQSGKYVAAISWPYLIFPARQHPPCVDGPLSSQGARPSINRSSLDSCPMGNFEWHKITC